MRTTTILTSGVTIDNMSSFKQKSGATVRVTDKVYPLSLDVRCVPIRYTRAYTDSFRIHKENLSYDRDSVYRWKEFYSDKTGSLPYREGSDISESYLEIN
jgi:hypothetical protein